MTSELIIFNVSPDSCIGVEWCRGVYESEAVSLMEFGLSERCELLSSGSDGTCPAVTLGNRLHAADVTFPHFAGYEVWSAEVVKDVLRMTFKKD